MTKVWDNLLQRIRSWPENAQQELAELAAEIDSEVTGGAYKPTPTELVGIDRGLRDAENGRFASESEVDALFAKYRRS
jgi:hypothetical protein